MAIAALTEHGGRYQGFVTHGSLQSLTKQGGGRGSKTGVGALQN
jgi:hypothetical protein